MADKRAEKLSAARKMLKQHQEKKREVNDSPPITSTPPLTSVVSAAPFENGNGSPAYAPPIPASPYVDPRHADIVSRLEEQVALQRSSIEMALGEKMALQRSLDAVNEELGTYKGSCEELTNRLKASRTLVSKLEKEVAQALEARAQHNTILHRLEMSLGQQKAMADAAKVEADGARVEVSRLLKDKESLVTEFSRLEAALAERDSQLSMATIRLQQVGGNYVQLGPSEELIQMQQRAEAAEHQLATAQAQFEEYMASVGRQLNEMSANYEKACGEKTELEARVSGLVEQIGWLEKQVQPQQNGQSADQTSQQSSDAAKEIEALKHELKTNKDALDSLRKELDITKAELDATKSEAAASRQEVESAKIEIEAAKAEAESAKSEIERLVAEVPDAQLLQAAMESDKVAATRAITQNQQLKQQLTDLQAAYVQAQDSKLEMTEQVERYKKDISNLNHELAEYIKQEVIRGGNINGGSPAKAPLVDGCCQTTYHDLAAATGEKVEREVTPEAAALLQDKFMATMNRLATLSDEKQRLEHLVIQLQSETDTIGEYIALYQTQRCKLQEKASENDRILQAVSQEKEELRTKLAEITALVPRLLGQAGGLSMKTIIQDGKSSTSNTEETVVENGSASDSIAQTAAAPAAEVTKVNNDEAAVAAERVLALLGEVAASGLVAADRQHALNEPCPNTFHPCSVCSGRLITV